MTDQIDPNQKTPAEGTTPVNADTVAAETATAESDLAREMGEMRDRHLRLAAEFDNFRRRAARERQEAGWRAQGELVRGLLDALDEALLARTVAMYIASPSNPQGAVADAAYLARVVALARRHGEAATDKAQSDYHKLPHRL